jgi:hypothetical protein
MQETRPDPHALLASYERVVITVLPPDPMTAIGFPLSFGYTLLLYRSKKRIHIYAEDDF